MQSVMSAIANFFRRLFPNFLSKKPKLSVVPPIDDSPSWYRIAVKEIGIKEFIPGDNPRILEYHATTKLMARVDTVPWCAAFVCWCLEKANVKSTRSAWARDYMHWGVSLVKPRLGCIVVLTRNVNSGHCGFWVDETDSSVVLLSGNTSDSVCIAAFPKANVLGYRWPS